MAVLAKSQNRQKMILLLTDSLLLDSQLIVQKSVSVSNENTIYLENIDYKINYSTQTFINLKQDRHISFCNE